MTHRDSEQHENAAIELLFGGKSQEALEAFEEGLRRFPGDAGLSVGRGMALQAVGRLEESCQAFEEVLRERPTLGDALQGLAESSLLLGRKERAIEAIRLACGEHETSAEFVHALGLLLFRNGLFDEAQWCYQRALELDPGHGHAWIGLAASLHQTHKLDQAISVLREAVLDKLPGFWEAYSYLGCLLFDAGRANEAKAILGKIPLDELRDPAAVRRLRAFLDEGSYPERAKVLAEIETRAKAALGKEESARRPDRRVAAGEPYLGTFIIGPVRGDYDGLLKILRHLELVDEQGDWLGKKATVVVIGPLRAEGPDGNKAFDLLKKLKEQAENCQSPEDVQIVVDPFERAWIQGRKFASSAISGWLITATGLSSAALGQAWETGPRERFRGAGPKPSFHAFLADVLTANADLLDGKPDAGPFPRNLISGQICARPEGSKAGVDVDATGRLVRIDSGLGPKSRRLPRLRLLCLRIRENRRCVVEVPVAEERFEVLKAEFSKTYGMEFPAAFLPDPLREPLHPESTSRMAFSAIPESFRLTLHRILEDPRCAPEGTWVVGWSGRQTSSWFYFIRKNHRQKVFLELPFGGAYANKASNIVEGREFLRRYLAFEAWATGRLVWWSVLKRGGECGCRIRRRDGCQEERFSGHASDFRFPNEEGADAAR